MKIDYYNGLTNKDFINYFLVDLKCLKELTQYTYPHEFTETRDAIDEHIMRCQDILWVYIYDTICDSGVDLDSTEISEIAVNKKKELMPLLEVHINQYIADVKVKYIDLR